MPAGIGTYVHTSDLIHPSVNERLRSWYANAKDSAVGGYRFLMCFYHPNDEIYISASRAAPTRRGSSPRCSITPASSRTATRCRSSPAQWQCRSADATPAARAKRHGLFQFMKAFRETFSRPVRRIQFLGQFDTVNSVPRFEAAWRCSARVIRHAVGVNDRRAKFRQDLVYSRSRSDKPGTGPAAGESLLLKPKMSVERTKNGPN